MTELMKKIDSFFQQELYATSQEIKAWLKSEGISDTINSKGIENILMKDKRYGLAAVVSHRDGNKKIKDILWTFYHE